MKRNLEEEKDVKIDRRNFLGAAWVLESGNKTVWNAKRSLIIVQSWFDFEWGFMSVCLVAFTA